MFWKKVMPIRQPNALRQNLTASLADVHAIFIKSRRAYVEIVTAPGEEFAVEYWDAESVSEDSFVKIETRDGELHVLHEQHLDWPFGEGGARIRVALPASYCGALNADVENEDVQIDPRLTLTELRVKTACGDIFIPLGAKAGIVEIASASGDLDLGELCADEADLDTASGDMNCREIRAKTVKLNSASGDLRAARICSEKVSVNSASGDIDIESVHAAEVNAQSAAGDIHVGELRAERFSLNNASGDLRATLYGQGALTSGVGDIQAVLRDMQGDITLDSTCGDVSVDLDKSVSCKIAIENVHGDVDTNLPNFIRRNARATAGDAESDRVLTIRNVNGDVRIMTEA